MKTDKARDMPNELKELVFEKRLKALKEWREESFNAASSYEIDIFLKGYFKGSNLVYAELFTIVEQLEQKVKELNQAISDNYENHPLKTAWEESQTKLSAAEKEIERLKDETMPKEWIRKNTVNVLLYDDLQSENATLKAQLDKCKEQRNYQTTKRYVSVDKANEDIAGFDAELAQLRKDGE